MEMESDTVGVMDTCWDLQTKYEQVSYSKLYGDYSCTMVSKQV